MMTPEMNVEFQKVFQAERAERGMIGARAYALGVMVARRRTELCAILRVFLLCTDASPGDLTALARVNGELTLLMIERGA